MLSLTKLRPRPLIELLQSENTVPSTGFAKVARAAERSLRTKIDSCWDALDTRYTEVAALTIHAYHEGQTAFREFKHAQIEPVLDEIAKASSEMHDLLTTERDPANTHQDLIKRLCASFAQGTRQEHQRALGANGEATPISLAESVARRNLGIATLSVGIVAGASFFPLLYVVSAGMFLYLAQVIYGEAYQALIKQRRLNHRVLNALIVTGAVLGGLLSAAVVGMWFGRLIQWLIVKTEDHSRQSLSDLFGDWPRTAWVLVDGIEVEIPLAQVQRGDRVIVHAGQPLPVDGVIVEGFATIDQHMLTGESQLVEKILGDPVLATTLLVAGRICVYVEKSGEQTVAAQIVKTLTDMTDFKQNLRSRAEAFVERITLPILALSTCAWPLLGLSSALAILWSAPGVRMVFFAPLSMLSFLQVAAQRGILIKDGRSLELLRDVDTVVFDKTGTLTLAEPQVGQIYCYNGLTEEILLTYAAAAEQKLSHPLARAIVQAAQARNLTLPAIDDAQYAVGYGITVQISGQTVRVGSTHFMEMEGILLPTTLRQQQSASHCLGHSLVLVALDQELAGALELQPTIRPEVQQICQSLRARNLKLCIISGDHAGPTQHLAQALGIDQTFAEVLPQDKASLIEQLQREGRKVCFVGDGINDALALKQAQVSVSLQGATTIATDAAQIVLMQGDLTQLVHLFEMAQAFEANMKLNFIAATVPGIVCIGGSLFLGWGLMTSVLLTQLTTPLAVYNAMRPLLNDGNILHAKAGRSVISNF